MTFPQQQDRVRPAASEKRIRRAVEMARSAVSKPELQEMYRRRFHQAMDALEPGEGEEVYHRCRHEGWYLFAAEALKRDAPA